MHYWNQEWFRYELYVVDLYENKQDEGVYKLLTQGNSKKVDEMSWFQLDTPIPIHQTFIFQS